jgi:hypothetical protein
MSSGQPTSDTRCPACGYTIAAAGADLCPNCGRRLQWQPSDPGRLQALFQPGRLIKSLLVRSLIAVPLAPLLVYASIWLSMITGSAKIQSAPAIMLGVVFGYGFGFGLAEKAGRVNAIVWIILSLVIVAIVAGAVFAVHAACPDLIARAGNKRFWFATSAFSGTTIMCALLALGYESKATILR